MSDKKGKYNKRRFKQNISRKEKAMEKQTQDLELQQCRDRIE